MQSHSATMEFRTEWDFSALSEFKRARRLLDASGTRARQSCHPERRDRDWAER